MDRIYFTTPIYYVNAEPHIGHLYTTALADMLKRYYRLAGKDVHVQTGTDEHGEKIVQSAAAQGISPQDFCNDISATFKNTWNRIGIDYDGFIRTTDSRHKQYVQAVLQQVYDAGDIYFDEYTGKYCVGCERYLTDSELVDGMCPDHQVAPKEIKEANYFFKMSRYQKRLRDHIDANPEWIRPERYRNEVLSFLDKPLEDLCISRPTHRLQWGIPLPFDDNFVTYVWFDALLNYVSGLKQSDDGTDLFATYWPGCNHLIAKDILKTHAIYWPTMLMSAGIPLFKQLDVHGYWLVGESKMSKSLGNTIRPLDFDARFGIENLRYFLFKEMKFGADANFTYDAFIERYNSDLANGLGNLLSRNAGLMAKEFGRIPAEQPMTAHEQPIIDKLTELMRHYHTHFETRQFAKTMNDVMAFVGVTDKYITTMEPWKMAKDPDQKDALARVLRTGLETVRIACVLLYPTMPQKCTEILTYLGETRPLDGSVPIETLASFGGLSTGVSLSRPIQFFPRIDQRSLDAMRDTEKATPASASQSPQKAPKESTPSRDDTPIGEEITIDDFSKVQLKVGLITEAHDVDGARKLVRLMVDVGETGNRQIFAGIKAHYPDVSTLVGQKVVVVANLTPRKMKFGISEGMILAAGGDGRLTVANVGDGAHPGDIIA